MIERILALLGRIPADKTLHFLFGYLIAALVLPVSFWLSVVAVIAAAVGKEVYDHLHPAHAADLWDAVATLLGALPLWLVVR